MGTKSLKELSIAHKSVNRKMDRAVREGMDKGMKWAVSYTKRTYFKSGGEPGANYIVSRSGKLRESVRATRAKNVGWKGRIFAEMLMGGPGMPYAGILEYGGRTSPHIIRPKKASVLHFFTAGGDEVFTMKVQHPGSVFEPRGILGRGMARSTPKIMSEVRLKINRLLKRAYA